MIIACMAIFILVLDSSAMNVAIGALVEELHTSISFIQAIIALYSLVLASFMMLGSKLQDIVGRKRIFLMRNDFSMNMSIADLIPASLVLGFGVGLLLSQLTNVTMSAAGSQQEAGASVFLNTSKNLGYSLGTALIGTLLLIGVFSGLVTSISSSDLSAGMTEEQVKTSLVDYMQSMQTSEPKSIGDKTCGLRTFIRHEDVIYRAVGHHAPRHGRQSLHAEDETRGKTN